MERATQQGMLALMCTDSIEHLLALQMHISLPVHADGILEMLLTEMTAGLSVWLSIYIAAKLSCRCRAQDTIDPRSWHSRILLTCRCTMRSTRSPTMGAMS